MKLRMRAWILGVVCLSVTAHATGDCEEHLLPTSELISYLEQLLDARVFDFEALSRFADHLDRGEIINPLSPGATSSASVLHRPHIDRILAAFPLDRAQLSAWARATLQARGAVRTQRAETQEATQLPFTEAHFITVPGGASKDIYGQAVYVPSFEISDILVTHGLWLQKTKQRPSFNSDARGGTLDHPVENISWWEAVHFANQTSIEQGWPAFYPLEISELTQIFRPTWKDWVKALPSPETHYGYRMPTYAEMNLLAERYFWPQIGGRPPTEQYKVLAPYIQIDQDSTQPVGTTERFIEVEGRPLHDLFGNTLTWTNDWKFNSELAEIDPPFQAVAVGIGYDSNHIGYEGLPTQLARPTSKSAFIGLRLVRTLPPTSTSEAIAATDHFIAYLESLTDERILSGEQLLNFESALTAGQVTNPFGPSSPGDSKSLIHSRQISQFLTAPLDREQILRWVRAKNRTGAQIEGSRASTRHSTRLTAELFEFRKVKQGRFSPEFWDKEIDVPDFEMMQAPVTQEVWFEIMKSNPALFPLGPRYPIENLTWWAAAVFANRTSEALGLQPYYDFSAIEWEPGTSAEEGTLMPSAKKGPQYWSQLVVTGGNGYRFLARMEWLLILQRLALRTRGRFHERNMLQQHAWWVGNANGTTHPVGTTPSSYALDDQGVFHDLLGNVPVWGHIKELHDRGRDGKPLDFNLLGGGYEGTTTLGPHQIHQINWNKGSDRGGIRLVRTLPEDER